jgi:hypothetical protein
MIGKPQIVIAREVDDRLAVHQNAPTGRGLEDPGNFIEVFPLKLIQTLDEPTLEILVH